MSDSIVQSGAVEEHASLLGGELDRLPGGMAFTVLFVSTGP
jgi:hypothetical protein